MFHLLIDRVNEQYVFPSLLHSIDSRFSQLQTDVLSYCNGLGHNCTLTVTKQGGAPVDLSLLNYTHYDYQIFYDNSNYNYRSFTC